MQKIYRLIVILIMQLFTMIIKGGLLPVVLDCENEKACQCSRPEKLDTFKVQVVLDFLEAKETPNNNKLVACCYHQVALEFYWQEEYIEAIKYNKLAEAKRLENGDGLLWKTLRNIGLSYYQLSFYKDANKYFVKAYETEEKKQAKDSVQLLRNIGELFLEMGELEKAIEYGRKAIQINPEDPAANAVFAQILNNTNDSSQLVNAIKYANMAIQMAKKETDFKKAILEKGNALNQLKKYNKAAKVYNDALKNDKTIEDTVYISKILNNLATVLFEEKKHQKAIGQLEKSLNLLAMYFKEDYSYYYSISLENLADNHTALQQFDTALLHYQKALINLTNNFRTEDIYQNPNPQDTSLFIYSNPDIIRVLHLKATAAYQYYQQNKNQKYLDLANQTYQTAFNFHDKLQREISTENSRLFQAENIVAYIENALKVAYLQQENGQDISKAAFRFMEKNKATVLLQSMNEADALQFANLPDSLIDREKELKLYITEYKRQRNNAIEEKDSNEEERLNTLLFEEEQQHRQLITNLETNNPNYYQLKYQQNQIQLADVQTQLDNKTALLECFVGDSTMYILSIQKNQSKLYQIPKPANWNQAIDQFRVALTDTETILAGVDTHQKDFVQYGHLLYKWLLQKPFEDLGNPIERLQIIPDAELNYIPFELLLTEKVDLDANTINYKKLPYLLHKQSVGYVYSAAFLSSKKTEGHESLLPLAGFAADYSNTDIEQLLHAEESVENIANKVDGKPFLKATKEVFINEAPKHKMLFFATHAELDDNNPMNSALIFTPTKDSVDYKLRAADLYNTTLHAEMALLSACETGLGKIHKGEGVMSLARAFTYAGCPSLVMSLWRISDSSTPKITDAFFDFLQKGLTKDKALQKAKLIYLENTPERHSHPAYWAGLVATGDLSRIDFGKQADRNFSWVVGFLSIICLGLIYIINKVI